jgi:hypothetical protein
MFHARSIVDIVHAVRSCQDARALARLAGPFRSFVARQVQQHPIPNGHLQLHQPTGWMASELNRWDLPPEELALMRRYAAGIDRALHLDPRVRVDAAFWRAIEEDKP